MRFLYNKLEQKKNVGLFANGSYKLAFLLKKIPFNNLSHGRWTYVLLVEPELSTVFFLEAKYVEQGNKGANSDTELQNISCYRETLKVSLSRFPTPSWRVGKRVRNYSVCMKI